MIDRKRVNPGFDIGEVLQKKRSHISVDLIAIRDRQIGTGATLRFFTSWRRVASERRRTARPCPNTKRRAAAGGHHRLREWQAGKVDYPCVSPKVNPTYTRLKIQIRS